MSHFSHTNVYFIREEEDNLQDDEGQRQSLLAAEFGEEDDVDSEGDEEV